MCMQTDKKLAQLKRISGQIEGIVKMYEEERACIDICRQIIAVRGSLGRTARDLLTGEACKCSKEARTDDLDQVLKELFKYE
ncbi:MAG: hypothetical protein CO156_05935 [Candidatus Pacebacteria bacterium CG_4_9_14_3_um_filter_40_12]|nr:MAG: hypothetical protein COU64_01715 [Candidatus Pacebacteria bacterium CG10_big_fil_rev_8_21_14_0_10_40_26]PIZ78647.1 MAG: hypothetical protein COY01_03380 [Candidatus Pacebacteria bacterium CG_4_10_14_0_2_um_filter_40_20]PJA68501.1 MAG: hypothetical protein CO156_05935 [Candidatus Pacebacteria bacterium CG_4_9_14_3_um_filter_40_12]PJC41870.1 MAG: hypothetical protein CO041_04080 [Candidatus Pacebacteria bacterium CG_4_9_14_0_2_um_filter_40_15]